MSTWTCFTVGRRDEHRFTSWTPRVSVEERAHAALTGAGFTSLFHHHRKEVRQRHPKRHSTRLIGAINEPLIPGYALVLNPEPDAQAAFEMAIRRLTMPSGRRGSVPVVSGILGQVAGGARALDHLCQTAAPRRLAPGMSAYITGGLYTQAEPIRIEVVDRKGATVTIGSLRVHIPAEHLEAAA